MRVFVPLFIDPSNLYPFQNRFFGQPFPAINFEYKSLPKPTHFQFLLLLALLIITLPPPQPSVPLSVCVATTMYSKSTSQETVVLLVVYIPISNLFLPFRIPFHHSSSSSSSSASPVYAIVCVLMAPVRCYTRKDDGKFVIIFPSLNSPLDNK